MIIKDYNLGTIEVNPQELDDERLRYFIVYLTNKLNSLENQQSKPSPSDQWLRKLKNLIMITNGQLSILIHEANNRGKPKQPASTIESGNHQVVVRHKHKRVY